MRTFAVLGLVGALALAGCERKTGVASGGLLRQPGRYQGVGLYPAGRMWTQLRQAAAKDAAAATLRDDEEVIVTVDSRTGELRQCGNHSGYCVATNPWARPADAAAPALLARHAEQLDQEAAAADRSVRADVTIAPAAPAGKR